MGSTQFANRLVMMNESRVFVECIMGNGYSVADVANPDAPTWLELNNPGFATRGVVFRGNTGFGACNYGIRAADLTDPHAPVLLDSVPLAGAGAGIEGLYMLGTVLYAASGDTLAVIESSNPAQLSTVARVALPGAGSGAKGGVACLAADTGRVFLVRWRTNPYAISLYLYNTENPAMPLLLDSLTWTGTNTPTCARFKGDNIIYGGPYGLFTVGLGAARDKLTLSDSCDVYGLYSGGRHKGSSTVSALEISGKYAVCACRCSVQVAVLDATDPAHLSLVSSTADDTIPDGQLDGLAVQGDFYYTAVEGKSFQIYELP